jgi:hypothetical protein
MKVFMMLGIALAAAGCATVPPEGTAGDVVAQWVVDLCELSDAERATVLADIANASGVPVGVQCKSK